MLLDRLNYYDDAKEAKIKNTQMKAKKCVCVCVNMCDLCLFSIPKLENNSTP